MSHVTIIKYLLTYSLTDENTAGLWGSYLSMLFFKLRRILYTIIYNYIHKQNYLRMKYRAVNDFQYCINSRVMLVLAFI